MEDPKSIKLETFVKKDVVNLENENTRSGLGDSSNDEQQLTRKAIYSIITVCFSTFFFGFCLSSSDFFIEHFNERLMINSNVSVLENMAGDQMVNFTDNSMADQMISISENSLVEYNSTYINESMGSAKSTSALTPIEESWFRSILLLGAFFGNIGISSFHLNRKLVIMINNFVYLVGVIVMYHSSHAAPLIIGKFIWGIASGISCAYVPAYLTELKIHKKSGMIGSFQSVLVTLGVIFGYLLEMCFKNDRLAGFLVISSFLPVLSVFSISILDTQTSKDAKNIKSLFKNRDLWKSVIICSTFHFTQQASGVNVVLVCASILLLGTNASKYSPVFVGLSQFLATLVAMSFVDRLGRKPLMIFSVAGVIISLSIIAFSHFVEIGMYLFMIFFSFGLGPITWFITGELVPLEYRDATNQIATSMNWLSAFVAVRTQEYLFKTFGAYMFTIYLTFMCIYLIYLIVFFKGTTGRPPSFL